MPTYEYECLDCNKIIEIVQSIKDSAISQCPLCDSLRFNRKISLPTIITKAKTSIIQSAIPNLIGGGGIDGSARLDMPGRVIGVKKEDIGSFEK